MDMAVYDPTVLDHFILGLGVRYNIRVERWGKEQKVYIVGVVGGVIGGVVGSFVSGVDGVVSGVGSVVSGATCGLVDWPTRKTISKPCSTFIGTTLGGLTNNGFVSVSFCQVWDEEQARIREGLRLMVYHFLIRLDRTDIRHAMEELENDNQRELLHLLVRAIAQYTFKALGGQRQVIVTNLI